MGNIIIGIKRFFQNKNTVTIFAILVAVGIIYFAYNLRIKKSTEPVNVPYATQEIGPRTYITNDMVSIRKIPGGVVTKDVLLSTAEIVGKYVNNKAVIPEGSMFYKSMVLDWDELPSSFYENIGEDETVFALKVDMDKTYGNSIFPGNYIDLYYKAHKANNSNKPWIGVFIEGIRVLDVQDADGNSVFETNGDPLKPAKLLFEIDMETRTLLEYISSLGIDLFPVPRNKEYSNQEHTPEIVGNELVKYVNDKSVDKNLINGGSK